MIRPGATHNEGVLDGGIAWRALGLVRSARHGNCAALSARLTTFRNWPRNRKQTPAALAEAGFYYGGEDDRVCIFEISKIFEPIMKNFYIFDRRL